MFTSSKRVIACAIICSFVLGISSCGKKAETSDISATVSSDAVTTAKSTTKAPEPIAVDDAYYENLNRFFESRTFDALVNVTPDSWATLDTPSRRYPVSYFLDCLSAQGILKSSAHQIITAYAKDGAWHVKPLTSSNFNPSSLTWGTLGVGKSSDSLDTIVSGEEQLAILLAHYYPNVSNAVLIFMVSGDAIAGDTCMPQNTIDMM